MQTGWRIAYAAAPKNDQAWQVISQTTSNPADQP